MNAPRYIAEHLEDLIGRTWMNEHGHTRKIEVVSQALGVVYYSSPEHGARKLLKTSTPEWNDFYVGLLGFRLAAPTAARQVAQENVQASVSTFDHIGEDTHEAQSEGDAGNS